MNDSFGEFASTFSDAWAFIVNRICWPTLPISDFCDGEFTLRRAHPDERKLIAENLEELLDPPDRSHVSDRVHWSRTEVVVVAVNARPSPGKSLGDRFPELQEAASLCRVELNTSIDFLGKPSDPMRISSLGDDAVSWLFFAAEQECTLDDLREISSVLKQLRAKTHPESIDHSLRLWKHFVGMNPRHFLAPLGMFIVIESLITHSPHARSDSLTHQVQSKMRLLEKRWQDPLPLALFGKFEHSGKLWESLYHFRGLLAHGGRIDFKKDAKIKELQSAVNITVFLREAAKRVLRQALDEPELVTDLQRV